MLGLRMQKKLEYPLPPGHALRKNYLCVMHALSITLSTSVYYGHYSQVCTLFNNVPPCTCKYVFSASESSLLRYRD